jgi:hypothetical protein
MQFNRFNNRCLDIKSRGNISEHLQYLLKNGQIKDCEYLKIEEGHLHAFYTKCIKDFATRIPASNVHIDASAGGAPSSYFWPNCPKDCLYYLKSEDFVRSLNSEVEEISNYLPIYECYVDFSRIKELNDLKQKGNIKFDLTKLIEMCEELNKCYSDKCFLAVAMLLRSILDHVPALFNKQNFIEVANNYKGKSFMKSMKHLQENSRDIADRFLHNIIRKSETLPTATQIDFRNNLDVLLEEIVRILKT